MPDPQQPPQYRHPKDQQYVTFGDDSINESLLLNEKRNEQDRALTRQPQVYDEGENDYGDFRGNVVRNSSNLKGASSYVPIGQAPREDELALIETLARGASMQKD